MSIDASTILVLLRKVAKHYNLDYDDVINLCDLGPKKIKKQQEIQLEYIEIDSKNYLYDQKQNIIYTYAKTPVIIGQLCKTTFKIITF